MNITKYLLSTALVTLLLSSFSSNADPVIAVKADIYKLNQAITIDSQIEKILISHTPIHQPRLLASLGKNALIEIGTTEQLTALEILSTNDGAFFNASMKVKDKVDEQWQSITSFMPHIPNGQTVYFSRNVSDGVWLIKLTGTRYETQQLGQQSF